jgi:methylthioribose-1-phosphate isomerase
MRIEGKEYRTIWYEENVVKIIDQTKLPHRFIIKELKTVKDAINAIKVMEVRGAPLIGGTAAYGMALAVKENNDPEFIKKSSIKTYCYKSKMGSRSYDEKIIRNK